MANKSVADRLSGVEAALHNVQQLANATAKGVGKTGLRDSRCAFAKGGFALRLRRLCKGGRTGLGKLKRRVRVLRLQLLQPTGLPPLSFSSSSSLWDNLKRKAWTSRLPVVLRTFVWRRRLRLCSFGSRQMMSARHGSLCCCFGRLGVDTRHGPFSPVPPFVRSLLSVMGRIRRWACVRGGSSQDLIKDRCSKILDTPPKRSGAGSRGARGAPERVEASGEVDLRSVVLQPGWLLWRGVTKSVKLLGLYYVLFVVFYRMWSVVPSTDRCLRPVPSG